MKTILTFDIGTTAVKSCVFDGALCLLGCANNEYALVTDAPGRVELPAETYWEAVCRGAAEAMSRAGIDPRSVAAVSVTTQGETLIPVGRDGRALRRAVVWLDQRADAQAARLAERFGAERFYAETGLPELNGYTPVAKLMWIRENEPEIYEKTDKFLLLEDYILMRLTGRKVTEKALVCSTGWYRFEGDGYWTEILEAAGIGAEKLPELLECGETVGGVLPEVRARLGLSEDVRAVAGAMDQTAGAVGAGNLAPGCITETTGTALCIGASMTARPAGRAEHITTYRHIRSGLYLLMPICMTAGMFLKWFKDNFCEAESAQAEREGRSVYALIDDIVAGTKPGAGGLVALPYLTGSLQPHNDPNARGVFFGVGLDTKKPQFLRAVFESVAFMLRENVELTEEMTGAAAGRILSLGGGAKSPVWCRIKADVTGVPIAVPAQTECTSLGVAALAAVSLGLYGSPEEAARAAAGVSAEYRPDPAAKAVYDRTYGKYRALYERLAPLF